MLPAKLTLALNDQFNNELQAAHSYTAMAAYFSKKGYHGFANFYLIQAQEEHFHAMKFYHFLVTMDEKPVLQALAEPKNHYADAMDVLESSLAQEKDVTSHIYALVTLAADLQEHATASFLDWFIEEQMEEEKLFRDTITRMKNITEGGEYFLKMNDEFAARRMEEA
ncbi:ferritin [Planomicrobium sp. CPCC 101079]|uniref:ferritin n=1 Tax=Planomicrobium sp. CPCC 101079 TaxID=2599618 RepID=UPI0011B74C44|nr:ferritin [Planomicrobium sp. CPCC 101079]TWT02465.1 ferritin [Planomicrobium sp. CPCC 101079]